MTEGILGIALSIIGVGGLATVLVESIRDWMIKRREEYLDIAKSKIESVSKAMPFYGKISTFTYYFQSELEKDPINPKTCLYIFCNLLHAITEYFDTMGGVTLDDFDAEYMILSFLEYPFDLLYEKFGFEILNKMEHLINDNMTYHEFIENLDNEVYKPFEEWSLSRGSLDELKRICQYYNEVTALELTHFYNVWYGKEPDFNRKLSAETIEFIKDKYPGYFHRLVSFNRGTIRRHIAALKLMIRVDH